MNLMPTPSLSDWNSMIDGWESCCRSLNIVHVWIGTMSEINNKINKFLKRDGA